MKKYVSILIMTLSSFLAMAQTAEKKTVFNVSKQNKIIAVSPTKMNVLYIGVDNPIQIAICDVPAKYITATIDNGTIENLGDGKFNVKVNQGSTETIINVYESCNGKVTKIGDEIFRVKRVPDPVAYVGGVKSGPLNKNLLAASCMLVAKMENFDFDLTFNVTSYTFLINVGGDIIPISVAGNMFPLDVLNEISKASPGTRIFFEDIKAIGPDGTIRTLSPVNIKLL
jgi:gliding motility-associated protein GldM